MNARVILIIDDETAVRKLLVKVLENEGYILKEAASGESGLEGFLSASPDIVLLDLNLPDIGGLEVLERILRVNPAAQVVMITGEGDILTAVNAMKLGAADFLLKPLDIQKLKWTLRVLLRHVSDPGDGFVSRSIVGKSPGIAEVWSQISRYAHPDISVLLQGESGTGKELFARAIHEKSKRCDEPFIALDCASLPDTLVESELFGHEKGAFTGAFERRIGRFELAQGGTIFLDEVGNLPLHFQAKLLRVIEERYVDRLGGSKPVPLDVRIISATNLDLEQAIVKGTFRQDLYYRLAEVVISLPPLRSRHGDIEVLTRHFVEEFNRKFGRNVRGISDAAWKILREYRWHGNVRELKNAIKSSLLLSGDTICVEHLPEYLRRAPGVFTRMGKLDLHHQLRTRLHEELERGAVDLKELVREYCEEIEKILLAELLATRRLTQLELCGLLNVNPKTLRAKLKRAQLQTRGSKG